MSRLLETIKVSNKKLFNIEYHNKRLNHSRKELFNSKNEFNLVEAISIPDDISNDLYKCRVVYSEKIISVDYYKYKKKKYNYLQVVYDDEISYSHKYEDRKKIEYHLSKTKADEILIIQNGFVTDTSFSNVVFFDGTKYFTPATPMLKGTKRAQLIDDGFIQEEEIKLVDIKKFSYIYLINAMLDLEEGNRIQIENIVL